MRLNILLLIIAFCLSSSLYSQSYRITKIIDTNLFELDNSKKVKLYGLYIPERKDANLALSNLANTVYQWEIENLLGVKIAIEILGISDDGIDLVAIYKNYPLFVRKNIANDFLLNGWAKLMQDINNDYLQKLIEYQEEAQKNNNGIWEDSFALSKDIDTPIINAKEIAVFTSRPYLPLLGLSIVSFALSWDFFSESSDIQKNIDRINAEIKLLPNIYPNVSLRKQIEQGLNDQIENFKRIKTRKTIVAITCIAAGVLTTLFSLKSVEVKTNLQSISLSYKF